MKQLFIYSAAATNQNFCGGRFETGVLSLPDLSPEIVICRLFDAREYISLQNFILLLYKRFTYEKTSDPSRLVLKGHGFHSDKATILYLASKYYSLFALSEKLCFLEIGPVHQSYGNLNV